MLLWLSSALAAPTVHVTVLDPSGSVVFDGTGPLPYTDTVAKGRIGIQVYVSTYDRTRGLLEVGAGPATKSGVKVKATASVEMDRYVQVERQIVWKDATFTVRAVFADPVAPPEPVPAPTTSSRFVRIWDDAELLSSPRYRGSAVRERALPGGRLDAASEASPMKVVTSWGTTHLEIETVPTPGPEHCYGTGGPPAEPWPLQFYVASADAVEVVVRPLSASFPDGTGYVVSPGVAVWRDDAAPGRATVASRGLFLDIPIVEEDLGMIYTLGERRPPGDAGLTVPEGTTFDLPSGRVEWAGEGPLPVSGIEGLDDPIATLRAGCIEVRVPFTPGRETGPSNSP
jgi:hypothetical protein